ncbi:MAG: carboxypeptidase-like regulatory domain-containing protein [Maribacter sp.]
MKTKTNWGSFSCVKELMLLTMKIFIFFFSILTFGLTVEKGFSQNEKIIFAEDAKLSIEEILNTVKKQTDYNFIYRSDLFEESSSIDIKKGVITVGSLLEKCASQTNFVYQFVDNKGIVLSKKSKVVKEEIIQQSVQGLVTDKDGNPLPGANIVEKGTTNGVTADFDGNFSIQVANGDAILVISYIGFGTKDIAVNGQSTINVSLEQSAAGLDEVVVVGYGTQSKKKVTSAVAEVDMAGVQDQPNSNAG